jgi:hypothetical protein
MKSAPCICSLVRAFRCGPPWRGLQQKYSRYSWKPLERTRQDGNSKESRIVASLSQTLPAMGRRWTTPFRQRFSPPLSFELICISCPTADLPILAAIVARGLLLGAIRLTGIPEAPLLLRPPRRIGAVIRALFHGMARPRGPKEPRRQAGVQIYGVISIVSVILQFGSSCCACCTIAMRSGCRAGGGLLHRGLLFRRDSAS